jgi:hypothetical protein
MRVSILFKNYVNNITEVISKVQREHSFWCFGLVDFDFLAINHTRGYVNELKIKRCRPKSKICREDF